FIFFFSSRRRHTRSLRDWSSDVCSSDLVVGVMARKGQDPQGRDQDDVAFSPYSTVQKKILGSPRLQIAYVSAVSPDATYTAQQQIGRASCRERVEKAVVAGTLKEERRCS